MPSEQPPTRVGTCTFCGGDGVVTRSFGINDSGRPEIVPCPSCQPAPPSEQPREGARVQLGYDDALTLHGIAQDAYNRALAPRDTTCNPNDAMHEAVDAVLDALHKPAQPQPRGEEAPVDPALYRQCEDSGHPPISRDQGCNCGFRPAPPRGEGDDLAARLEEKSNVEEGLRPARPTNLPGPDLYHLGRAEAFAEAAQLARASTHPEQWGGSIRGCSPSSTRTPPTNAGRRGLAGSTDTNAPRGSCSNEPMPR